MAAGVSDTGRKSSAITEGLTKWLVKDMRPESKRVEDILPSDLDRFPIWEFDLDEETTDGLTVFPVGIVPVHDASNRIVGTKMRLANGQAIWALLGNVDLKSSLSTRQFLTVSIFYAGRRFHLARYFDVGYAEQGPTQLAELMGLSVDEVFPITYDIRSCCVGNLDIVVGVIEKEPKEKFSRSELISLAVPKPGR